MDPLAADSLIRNERIWSDEKNDCERTSQGQQSRRANFWRLFFTGISA